MAFTKKNIELNSDNYLVIEINETEIGLTNMSDLRNETDSAILSGEKNIVLDLKSVNVINSSGLGVLIGILKKVKTEGGKFALSNTNEKLMNIFKITKLNLVFDFINL